MQMKLRSKKLRLYSLDTLDANLDEIDSPKPPLILTNVGLQSSIIVLNPSIDEIQQLMHQFVNYVLNIFHGLRKWGEVRHVDCHLIHDYPMQDFSDLLTSDENISENIKPFQQAKTYYNTIVNNKELIKLYQNVSNFFLENSNR